MSGQLSGCIERRERLVALAALQRSALAREMEPLRPPLRLADQGLAALRYIRTHPGWVVGGVILLATMRLGRGGIWLRRGLMTWQVMHAWRAT